MSVDTSIFICQFFIISANDARLTMPHLCVFLALLNVWVVNLYQNPVIITKSQSKHSTSHVLDRVIILTQGLPLIWKKTSKLACFGGGHSFKNIF